MGANSQCDVTCHWDFLLLHNILKISLYKVCARVQLKRPFSSMSSVWGSTFFKVEAY